MQRSAHAAVALGHLFALFPDLPFPAHGALSLARDLPHGPGGGRPVLMRPSGLPFPHLHIALPAPVRFGRRVDREFQVSRTRALRSAPRYDPLHLSEASRRGRSGA